MKCQACPTVNAREAFLYAFAINNPMDPIWKQVAMAYHLCRECAPRFEVLKVLERYNDELFIPQGHMAESAKQAMMIRNFHKGIWQSRRSKQ